MTEITPQQQKLQVIIEKAKLAVERVQGEVSDETTDLKQKTGEQAAASKQTEQQIIRAETIDLPPEAQNQAEAREIIARLEAIRGNIARFRSEVGSVEVRLPEGVELTPNQKVIIEIPPNTRTGSTVQINYVPQVPDLPDVRVDPVSFPPLQEGEIIIATYTQGTPLLVTTDQPDINLPARIQNLTFPQSTIQVSTLAGIETAGIETADFGAKPPFPVLGTDNVLTQTRSPFTSAANEGTQANLQNILPTASFIVGQLSEGSENASQPNIANLRQLSQNSSIFGGAPLVDTFTVINLIKIIPKASSPAEIETIINSISHGDKKPQGARPDTPHVQTTAQSPQQAASPIKPDQPLILAEVIGHNRNGQTVIKTDGPEQSFTIQTPTYAPIGSQLVIQTADIDIQTLQSSPDLVAKLPTTVAERVLSFSISDGLPPPINLGFQFSQTWPALQESITTLLRTAPQVAQAVQNSVPTASPRLVATAMFFMSALKLGGIDNWLGDKGLGALEKAGKSGLSERLGGDFSRMTSASVDSNGGQWKGVTLPLLYEGQISNIQLFIRGNDAEGDQDLTEDKDDKTRFILDLDLSKIGPMQLDGYLTPKSLDIILRTDHKLDGRIRQDLMQIFHNAKEMLDLNGGLSFQGRAGDFIKIQPDKEKEGVYI